MKDYTLIYAFSGELLIAQLKPKNHFNPYLAGKWTVPGGKVEPNEITVDGAAREFLEETGLDINGHLIDVLSMWCNCLPSEEPQHRLHVFTCELDKDFLMRARTTEQEIVEIVNWRVVDWTNFVRYTQSLVDLCQTRLGN